LLSPMPMPLGLLVVATLVMVLFVASALSLRLHFGRERSQALHRLQQRDAEQQRTVLRLQAESDDLQDELERQQVKAEVLKDKEQIRDFAAGEPSRPVAASAKRSDGQEQLQHIRVASHHEKRMELLRAREVKEQLQTKQMQIEGIAEGVFKPLSQTAYGWILGGGTTLALVDLWLRWWLTGS